MVKEKSYCSEILGTYTKKKKKHQRTINIILKFAVIDYMQYVILSKSNVKILTFLPHDFLKVSVLRIAPGISWVLSKC